MADLTLSPLNAAQAAAVSTVQGLLDTLRLLIADPATCQVATGPDGATHTIDTRGDLTDAVEALESFVETMNGGAV